MERTYRQLTLEERCQISCLYQGGQSLRQIAEALDRAASTVARELKRNSLKTKGYEPAYAWQLTQSRRWRGSRMERQPALRQLVLERLAMEHSPEQVAGRLALEQGSAVISHESIYRFIYAQIRRTNDGSWRHYLPRAKSRRGWRGKPGGSPASFIQGRVSIHERPSAVATRAECGHWEADLMLFSTYGQAVLVAHERYSRLLIVTRQPNKTATLVADNLNRMLEPLPGNLRQTMTFDNGTEFAQHHRLPMKTFFCDTHSPGQKGGVENAIGRLRRNLPRKTDINTISEKQIIELAQIYNHTPRKCLDYKTPAEVFLNQLLHFKCEFTSRLSSG